MADNGGVRGGRVRFNNMSEVYDLLVTKAEITEAKDIQEFGYPATEGESLLIYRGHSTKDCRVLGMLDSAISHALATLKAMNAITLLRTGSKERPSVYILHYKPTMENFEQFIGRSYTLERKMAPTTYDQLVDGLVVMRERMDKAERRIAELEEKLNGGNDFRRGQTLPQVQ